MNNKKNVITYLLLVIVAFSNTTQAKANKNIDIQKISNTLQIFNNKEYGTNIGVVKTTDGVVLIDPMPGEPGLSELNETIKETYQSKPWFIVNTHGHEDHTGGNAYFLNRGAKKLEGSLKKHGIEHIVVASHSPSDKVYYHTQSNSIFVGDVFESNWHPTFYFGGRKGLNNAIEQILALGDENSTIIPGHGVITDKETLRQFRDNTFKWVDRVKELISMNVTVDEIMKDKKANGILAKFSDQNSISFLPKKAHKRFIERTFAVIEKEQTSE